MDWVNQASAALLRDGSSLSAFTIEQLRAWWSMHAPGNPQTGLERFDGTARPTVLDVGRVDRALTNVKLRMLKVDLTKGIEAVERYRKMPKLASDDRHALVFWTRKLSEDLQRTIHIPRRDRDLELVELCERARDVATESAESDARTHTRLLEFMTRGGPPGEFGEKWISQKLRAGYTEKELLELCEKGHM